ncbi:hypothetical protein [Anaerovorax odorimutans]|uniref:hypothetical protein n=1 Tax=Anaerovorax odorimutans TaxID=109327 RepID=UPI00210B1802|nr:hypothetical protein [Anaerovorax odorimutans]
MYNALNWLSFGRLDLGRTYLTSKPGSYARWDSFFGIAGIIIGAKYVKGKGGKFRAGSYKAKSAIKVRTAYGKYRYTYEALLEMQRGK